MSQQTLDRLNNSIIRILSADGDLDRPYLLVGNKSYTKREMIVALENNDPIAENMIDNLILLTVDLLDRKKITQDGTK